jgi:hypothetical protein
VEIPRFVPGTFNERIAGADPGTAFQVFAGEVLSKRNPGLHAYRTAGRDGAIDLDTPTQTVFECKYSGGSEIQKAWDEVAKRLQIHLRESEGPAQSQYKPWYATGDDAITRYVFATNIEFANKSRRDALRSEIELFFRELAALPHLVHLKEIEVEVRDWSDFESDLKRRPELVFRWFPSTRPNGLMPLDDAQEGQFFRAFLSEATLPYYSRAAHAAVVGGASPGTPPEDDLLALLDRRTGLIITGKGGVGKTRLTLELGRRAKQKGWLVLRASASFREAAIDQLLTRFVEPINVLLLIDYVELIAAFADRVEHIEMLNATLPHRIRYIANCRTTYYRNVQTVGGHERIDVTPVAGLPSSWLDGYRRAIIERVLSTSAIEITPAHLSVCRDVPVLAVFMAYLQRQRRTDDLHELVADGEFGVWIARRIQQSFGREIGKDLAILVAAFPMPEVRRRLLPPSFGELFDRLAADGWIEQLTEGPEAGQWVTAHDALADRMILNHIESVGGAALPFIEDLLDFAETNDVLPSVLISLQRLADAAVMQTFDWVGIFAARLNDRPSAWRASRLVTLQNNLVPAVDRIELLDRTQNMWDDLAADAVFQNILGWICKQIAEVERCDERRETLKYWVLRSAPRVDRSNYLLTRGLIVFPEVRSAAERWLATHPIEFQTHYLLVAWLTREHGEHSVVRYVTAWLGRFAATPQASFVFRAWLDAGGEHSVVEVSIERWLEHYAENDAARFVYRAWLDAGGDHAVVEEPIDRWLAKHGQQESTRFVYGAWLKAGGDHSLVQEPVKRWLADHAEKESAQFVYHAWLDAGGDHALVKEPMGRWFLLHAQDEDAPFVYRAWLGADGDRAVVEEPIRLWLEHHAEIEAAQYVYCAWFDAGGDLAGFEEPAQRWLRHHAEIVAAQFVYRSWLDSGGYRRLVEEPIRRWLVHHGENEVAGFVYRAWLDAGGGFALVEEAVGRWLLQHAEAEGAGFVYRAWLDAGGPLQAIESYILDWLNRYSTSDGADFLVVSFLKRGGAFKSVRDAAAECMSRLRESPAGAFLSKVLAKQPDLSDESVSDILTWCSCYADDADGLWRLSQLGMSIARNGVAAKACEVAEVVLTRWLDPLSALEVTIANSVTNVLATLMLVQDAAVRQRVDQMFVQWFRHPVGFELSNWCRYGFAWRLIAEADRLIGRRVIDVVADSAALDRLVRWGQRCDETHFARFAILPPAWLAERLTPSNEAPAIQP